MTDAAATEPTPPAAPAAETPPEAPKKPAAPKQGMGIIAKSLLMIFMLAGIVFLQKAMLFGLLAMMPSLIAYFMDRDPRKPIFFTITAFNFAGLFPYFMQVLHSQSLAYESEEMLTNVQAWFIIYGAAGIGWLLVLAGPTLSLSLVQMYYKGKVAQMELEQKAIASVWDIEGEKEG